MAETKERMDLQKMSSYVENEEEFILPGFRFHPTDEELVGFYLRRKVEMKTICIELIKQINIYKYDPWDLPKVSSTAGDKEWYFFCKRGRKYRNSIRPNRVTGSGFWKATGIDRPIHSSSVTPQPNCDSVIGLKKSLVYYRGSAGKGTKTDWMMHEFRLPAGGKNNDNQEAEIWTICRIFKRNVTYRKYTQDCRGTSITENQTALSPKSSSFESENGDEYSNGRFGASGMEMKPVISQFDEKNQYFSSPPSSVTQGPFPTFYSSFHAGNNGEFLTDCNWDEIGSTLEFPVVDPALLTGCRYY